jgi:hypothetical protein
VVDFHYRVTTCNFWSYGGLLELTKQVLKKCSLKNMGLLCVKGRLSRVGFGHWYITLD